MDSVQVHHMASSLLAANFNALWCAALNEAHSGKGVSYFAMLHSDIAAEDFWIDKLIEELESHELDVIGAIVPIKDQRGMTSCSVDGDGTWRPKCRVTMQEAFSLPPTFTSDDVGGPLLINTGCWVCKFDLSWVRKVHFTINDRIVFSSASNSYVAEVEPEDWFFSRLCHELKLRIGATRTVSLSHRGEMDFSNQKIWGQKHDTEYGHEGGVGGLFPFDVEGWLEPDEGLALAKLSEGKDVLEIGSYAGRSTICIARKAKSVACVDYFDGRATPEPKSTLSVFMKNIEKYGLTDKVSTHHPDDKFPPNTFDLVFIDGDHSREAVAADIEKACAALKPGGLLAFHDYHSPVDPGVTAAVNELIENGGRLIEQANTLAVVRPPVYQPVS